MSQEYLVDSTQRRHFPSSTPVSILRSRRFEPPQGPADYAAVSQKPGAQLRVSARDLWLADGDGLQGTLYDRTRIRKIGAVLAGLGALAFVPLIATGPDVEVALGVSAGLGAVVISGAIMLLMRDRTQLSRCVACNVTSR